MSIPYLIEIHTCTTSRSGDKPGEPVLVLLAEIASLGRDDDNCTILLKSGEVIHAFESYEAVKTAWLLWLSPEKNLERVVRKISPTT